MASEYLIFTNIVLLFFVIALLFSPFFISKNFRTRFTVRRHQAQQDLCTHLAETHNMWVWKTDRDGFLTRLSPLFYVQTALKPDDVIGKPWDSLFQKATLEEASDFCQARDEQKPLIRSTAILLLGQHAPYSVTISGQPYYSSRGLFDGMQGLGYHQSPDSPATQEKEGTSNHQLIRIIEDIPEGLALCHPDGTIALHNQRLYTMIEEAGGAPHKADTFSAILQSCHAEPGDPPPSSKKSARVEPRSETIKCLKGQSYFVRYRSISDDFTLVTVSDVTEQQRAQGSEKRLEEERRQTQKLEAIGTLAGGIAHEINTPIQYIGDNIRFVTGVLPTLLSVANTVAAQGRFFNDSNEDRETVTAALNSAAQKCRELDLEFITEEAPLALEQALEGISVVSRIVLAMKEFSHPNLKNPVPFDLNHNLQNTITISRNEWKTCAEMHTDLDPDLPPVTGLPGDLNQVFLNLIVNAAHAIEDKFDDQMGHINISTRQKDDYVEVRIADTGCGIPQTIRDKIFEPFFTTKDVKRGTGQGLTIAHDIVVRKHGGKITILDQQGGGTIFVIHIPFDPPIPHEPDSAENPQTY